MTSPSTAPGRLRGAVLTGLGAHRPAHREDNSAVAERTDSSDEWIRSRSGIVTRGVSVPGLGAIEMGADAGAKALAAAGVDPERVDLVLLASCSVPGKLPGGSPEVASRVGATRAGASDVGAGCAGFTYALSMAADTVKAGSADTVLVVGSEQLLPLVDPHDRGTAFLFGDGAGAAVVQAADDNGVFPVVWSADGAQAGLLRISGEPPLLTMEGRAIYRWATTSLPDLARRACARAGLAPRDLKAFVPHQANLRITEAVAASLELPDTCVVARDVVDSGNTSAASIPLALARLVEAGEVHTGDPVLLMGFGAGLTAAGQVVLCP